MASHIFIRRLVARDLDELDSAQHRDPDQLKNDPHVENQGESVPSDIVTQGVIDDIALGIRRWEGIDV